MFKKYFFIIFLLFICNCGTVSQKLTMWGANDVYNGKIICGFQGAILNPSSGTITIEKGPDGETFSGPYTIMDRTPRAGSQSSAFVPMQGNIPAIGQSQSQVFGKADATAVWVGQGNRGSRLEGEIPVSIDKNGVFYHGQGSVRHNDGRLFKIMF